MEERKRKIVIGVTAAAVVLLAILIIFWIYQMIAIGSRNARIAELNEQIAYYERIINDSSTDLETYQESLLWLERAARELGMLTRDE